MGIQGLTTFIDRNPHLLHSHKLQNCSVVIDGNNFYHYIYYACHVSCALGGDYDVYRKQIISTFKALEKCNIIPYVVLDGAYTTDDKKLRTSLMRATMRNTLVSLMTHCGRGQVLPILAYDTFIQVLMELGVHHVTCQFEADVEIAVLANKLKCPVISNDSDFYIFDLIEGFLPLDYIDFRPLCEDNNSSDPSTGSRYLHSQIYHVDDFINSFKGLSRSALPVFASLLGNDYVKSSAFDSFYSSIQVPKVVSKKFDLPSRLSKIISVLHWFHIHNKDWSHLLHRVLQFLQPQSQSKLRKLFLSSVNVYSNIDKFEGCDLFAYFHNESKDFTPVTSPDFSGYNGGHFPEWFLKSICRGEITPSIMNAAVLHRIILLSQVEDVSAVTTYQCSKGIRNILYGIILISDPVTHKNPCPPQDVGEEEEGKFEELCKSLQRQTIEDPSEDEANGATAQSQNDLSDEEIDEAEEKLEEEVASLISQANPSKFGKKQTQMEEYNRVRRHMQRSFLEPTLKIIDSSLPNLTDLEFLSVVDRRHILLSAMEVDISILNKFSTNHCLFSSCLITWLKNADPKLSERHLDCIIMCFMYLNMHNKVSCKLYQRKEENEGTDLDECNYEKLDFTQTLRSVPHDQLNRVRQNLSKYHKNIITFNKKNHMDTRSIHGFGQLQACILDASNLNKLLRFPLPSTQPALLLNGTFLYNLFSDLISRPKPELFLGSLLIEDSPIHKLFVHFKFSVLEFLTQNVFVDTPQKHSRKSRKRRPAKDKASSQNEQASNDVKSSESGEDDKEITVITGFDISNKFLSLLSLDN